MAEQSVSGIDPHFVRNMALIRLVLARAHTQTGDIDAACEQIAEAASLARHNSSPRLAGAVAETRKQLRPWHGSPGVAALDERLRAYRFSA